MGTDLSAYIEYGRNDAKHGAVRRVLGEVWLHRTYVLFGLMAGIRGDEQLFTARGLPANVESILAEICNESGETASWLTANELVQVLSRLQELSPNNDNIELLKATIEAMRSLDKDQQLENHSRLVFWVDS